MFNFNYNNEVYVVSKTLINDYDIIVLFDNDKTTITSTISLYDMIDDYDTMLDIYKNIKKENIKIVKNKLSIIITRHEKHKNDVNIYRDIYSFPIKIEDKYKVIDLTIDSTPKQNFNPTIVNSIKENSTIDINSIPVKNSIKELSNSTDNSTVTELSDTVIDSLVSEGKYKNIDPIKFSYGDTLTTKYNYQYFNTLFRRLFSEKVPQYKWCRYNVIIDFKFETNTNVSPCVWIEMSSGNIQKIIKSDQIYYNYCRKISVWLPASNNFNIKVVKITGDVASNNVDIIIDAVI